MPALAAALAIALAAPLASADAAAGRLTLSRPGTTALRAAHGGLFHLSGLAEPRAAAGDEENARRFLEREGEAFGVDPAALATLRVLSAPGSGGAAIFRRTVAGLPVFGGDVAVGWRADGAITAVNGSSELATEPDGEHALPASAAVEVALAAGGEPGEVAAEPGWIQFAGRLVPVHRIAHGTAQEAAYTFVHAGTGELLWRASRVRSAAPWSSPCPPGGPCIRAFLGSPLAPPTASPGGNAPEDFLLQGLQGTAAPGARLTGSRTSVYACAGTDRFVPRFPRICETPRAPAPGQPLVGGQLASFADGPPPGFVAGPDATQVLRDDPFAEQNAYFHIDAHSRFLDLLDPAFAARTPAGGVGFVSGYVNAFDGAAPFDNAYFSPVGGQPGASGVMVFGQGALVDLAYDAEVLYHELTHAAVEVTAGFQGVPDGLGVNSDPDSINEGTADTFAFIHVGEALREHGLPVDSASCLARYFGSAFGLGCLRDARNERTCRGAGPNAGRNPGRTGEVHDDGEIWSGFTWALYSEATRHGLALPMASALFQAMALGTPQPTYTALGATVLQKVRDLGLGPEAEAFTACTIAQRDLAGCADRAVALYSGERAEAFAYGLQASGVVTTFAGQQYFVDVPCGAAGLRLQVGDLTGTGTLYVRYGRPIEFGLVPPLTPVLYDWSLRGNHSGTVISSTGCVDCLSCGGTRTPFGAGRWYFAWGGTTGGRLELGVSIEMADDVAPPPRPPPALGTCTWGAGPTPVGQAIPVGVSPPPIGCEAPLSLAEAVPCGNGREQLENRPRLRSCGCSHGSAEGSAAALAVLLLLRRRRRA